MSDRSIAVRMNLSPQVTPALGVCSPRPPPPPAPGLSRKRAAGERGAASPGPSAKPPLPVGYGRRPGQRRRRDPPAAAGRERGPLSPPHSPPGSSGAWGQRVGARSQRESGWGRAPARPHPPHPRRPLPRRTRDPEMAEAPNRLSRQPRGRAHLFRRK